MGLARTTLLTFELFGYGVVEIGVLMRYVFARPTRRPAGVLELRPAGAGVVGHDLVEFGLLLDSIATAVQNPPVVEVVAPTAALVVVVLITALTTP